MPPRKMAAASGVTPVDDLRHDDTRANIPTGELAGFVADEDAPPAVRYARDPSLDPQLVWRGKDEQDSADLEVPSVPVYVQEKVVPRALVEDLRPARDDVPSLFDDFDGLDFSDKVDFYAHEANWSNRMILGDSLLAMTSLAEREGLRAKVQMIYIDPPYGIRFGSNWQVSTRKREVKDGKVEDATRQPEQVKAFRDTWELGIHSYLAYLRDRLVVARELLTESGSVFVQIGDENVHLVRSLLDEVFGSENFVGQISVQTTTGASSPAARTDTLASVCDYVIWYARDQEQLKYRQLLQPAEKKQTSGYRWLMFPDGKYRGMTAEELRGDRGTPVGARTYKPDNIQSPGSAGVQEFVHEGKTYRPGQNSHWKASLEGMRRLAAAGRIHVARDSIQYVRMSDDFVYSPLSNVWTDVSSGNFTTEKVYVVQTNLKVIERCLLMTTDPGDLVLDPTCGSGSTALLAEQWGRRWITTDTSRVALTLTRTRMMAARLPYFLLADSPEGLRKEAELLGATPDTAQTTHRKVRKGFVYARAARVTLGSISRNPDIVEGMTREQIDAAIARHAESELLYDQPYEDKGRVRVSGPFTVESLAPHRTVAQPERPAPPTASKAVSYEQTVLENLKKAGVQNGWRSERLVFDRVEPYAGHWIQALGHAVGEQGAPERVGIALGPQYGTVDADLVQQAAKEAVRGAGLDLLLVCGFAFDPRASEKAKEFAPASTDDFAVAQGERHFGRLPVLLVRVNPDLAMGDTLLKATGAGNLFTVFGEPDIALERTVDGLVVEIRGLDVYDPTTGTVRSSSTDDIACWFIDTNYDEESFFVRHAYFTGADEPYAKLQRALRTEVDPDAWASLYLTRSRPFPAPSTGKIAVKVISHYGDEVLQVYDV